MKNIIISIFTFLFCAFNSQGQGITFEKEEKKAKEFMESKILEIYNGQFKTKFVGTWNEFGKIYGFMFYILENKEDPIAVEYNLNNQDPFEFDKNKFEKEYNISNVNVKATKQLENEIQFYYPKAKALANRISNRDSSFRWVNKIYIPRPLESEKERTFTKLDSIVGLLLNETSEKESVYNFYFPKETDSTEYTNNQSAFFEFENFYQKYLYHYSVRFEKNDQQFKIIDKKLYDNLNEEQTKKLKRTIRIWRNQNGFEYWDISLLTENDVERNIEFKKFMLKSRDGEKKFGFINFETKELKWSE